jgi:stage V sporulation protein G
MEITEVKVFPVRDKDRDKKLRAFVSIVFDGSFMVNDIKVIQGKDGFFISMPSRRKKNGRFKDIAHPLNQETRQLLEERIVAEYERVAEGGGTQQPAPKAAAQPRSQEAAPVVSADPRPEGGGGEEGESSTAGDKSLEEVTEAHLSDSYWTT